MQETTPKQPSIWQGHENPGQRQLPAITLLPVQLSDVDFILQLANDPQVTKYIPGLISSRSMLESWLQNLSKSDHEYLVLSGEEKIGECSLNLQGESAELGIMLLPSFWGQGYGSATIEKLLLAAKDLQIKELTAMTEKRNKACLRLLYKYGFTENALVLALLFPDLPHQEGSFVSLHKLL